MFSSSPPCYPFRLFLKSVSEFHLNSFKTWGYKRTFENTVRYEAIAETGKFLQNIMFVSVAWKCGEVLQLLSNVVILSATVNCVLFSRNALFETLYSNQILICSRIYIYSAAYRILMWNSRTNRSLRRSKCRWENNIKMGLKLIRYGVFGWVHLDQDRSQQRLRHNLSRWYQFGVISTKFIICRYFRYLLRRLIVVIQPR